MSDADRYDPAAQRAPVKSTTEARQGVTGQNTRGVLMWGTGAAIVCLIIIFFIYFAH